MVHPFTFQRSQGGKSLADTDEAFHGNALGRFIKPVYSRRPISTHTLIQLRWLAVLGQSVTMLFVQYGLGFALPLGWCFTAVAASIWLNLTIMLRYKSHQEPSTLSSTLQLGFDISQLSALLFLTGGLANPFSFLLLMPTTAAFVTLPNRTGVPLLLFSLAIISLLTFYHLPLPWHQGQVLTLPPTYLLGSWVALGIGVVFAGVYARRVAFEYEQIASALATTQKILAQEEMFAALGSLAAAAAHELGTPLSTIQLAARELADDLPDGTAKDDTKLILDETKRCREILTQLSAPKDADETGHSVTTLPTLLEEIIAPCRAARAIPITVSYTGDQADKAPAMALRRKPEMIYGLRAIIDNAVKFTRTRVTVECHMSTTSITLIILDDGRGFSPDILTRLGSATIAKTSASVRATPHSGLGLGFFIAKNLLERTKAKLRFGNRPRSMEETNDPLTPVPPQGAWVSISWRLADLAVLPI